MTDEEPNQWQTCVVDPAYEICIDYPHPIRKQANGRIVKEGNNGNGYVRCNLNRVKFYKHRLVALQFIPNPNGLPEIDHINHNRADNRIENLRWVSLSENNSNKVSQHGHVYEYFDELPAPCQPFIFYKGHDLEGYMIDEEHNIYFHNGYKYRKLVILLMRQRYEYYRLVDIEGRFVTVMVNQIDNYL
jgi:hypothetical protein